MGVTDNKPNGLFVLTGPTKEASFGEFKKARHVSVEGHYIFKKIFLLKLLSQV